MNWRLVAIVGFVLVGLSTLTAAEEGKIRVLLTVGGHAFEEQPFYAMFDAMADVEYKKIDMPKEADLLKPGLEKDYDCIVMYDMNPGLTPEQQANFARLAQSGIGIVSMHHNMGANRDWPEYRKIIGGKFVFENMEIDGQQYKPSTWSHGETLKVTVVDKQHPITQGVQDFEIHDETYGGYFTSADAKVLLKTEHPKNDPELAWVTQYGKSRVFYLMLGHDGLAYGNPSFRKVLHQGIRWAAEGAK